MSTRLPETDPMEKAVQAVRDYLEVALQPRFLGLHTEDILCAAESVWNNYEPGSAPPSFEESGVDEASPVFQELVQELDRARRGRFEAARFFVLGLTYDYEQQDVLFSCDLMWPEPPLIHPFRMRVPRDRLAPPDRN